MPMNITELRRVEKYYEEAGLPGCCRSMDVVHVKWTPCPTGDHNCAKGKGGIPVLRFSALPISITGSWPSTVHNLVPEITRRSLRTILTFILFKWVGIMMSCGIITLQKAEWSR